MPFSNFRKTDTTTSTSDHDSNQNFRSLGSMNANRFSRNIGDESMSKRERDKMMSNTSSSTLKYTGREFYPKSHTRSQQQSPRIHDYNAGQSPSDFGQYHEGYNYNNNNGTNGGSQYFGDRGRDYSKHSRYSSDSFSKRDHFRDRDREQEQEQTYRTKANTL